MAGQSRSKGLRTMVTGVACLLAATAAGAARANTIHFEAESVRDRLRGFITSPLQIRDDAAASGGSYVTVTPGTNSPSNAPASATDGVARYVFTVADTGSYRIWARVSAPSTGDDSFWIRIGPSAPWIRWNEIPLGTPYHWVLVRAENASGAARFNLTGGADNELQVAYREDGTRLDAFFITNDSNFNPNATLTGPPALPFFQPAVGGQNAIKVSWSAVPGATSYNIERRSSDCSFNEQTQCCESPPFQTIRTGVTVHKFTDTVSEDTRFTYRITAVARTGASAHPVPLGPANCFPTDPSQGSGASSTYRLRTQIPILALTPPMRTFPEGVGAPAGFESLGAIPARGRARLDFELAVPTTIRVWAEVVFPNRDQDSFWVKMDDMNAISWNNLNEFCEDVHDSRKRGEPTVLFKLPAGSHRIEWAPREGGALLADNIVLVEDPTGTKSPPCSD
jgi:hypothetical protein